MNRSRRPRAGDNVHGMMGRVGWFLWIFLFSVTTVATWLGFNQESGAAIGIADALWAYSLLGFPAVGALVVGRMPRRPLGWILLLAPGAILTGVAVSEAALRIGEPSDKAWAAWAGNLLLETGFVLLLFVPLLIPTGLLPSRRWRPLAWFIAVFAGLQFVVHALAPDVSLEFRRYPNPVGIEAMSPVASSFRALAPPILLVLLMVTIFSVIVRFRKARGDERQQMKWLAAGAGFAAACLLSIPTIHALAGGIGETAMTILIIASILALPVALGIAMLRYRLYDIDVIVNRALVYAALTALLGAAYAAVVFVLQSAAVTLGRDSDVAVAASTLAVAALFRPIRARVQAFIDRRFYRSKYNAAQTLAAFGVRLRNEVDLDSIEAEVVTVLGTTIQPRHAQVWLRR